MKKLYFILLFLLSVSFISAENYKVLFIGNSYTSVNDLPTLVSNVSLSAGDTVSFSASTPGGCTFEQHLSVSASLIQQGGWDYVILQEQSQLPSFPDGQFMNQCYPYAQQLCEMVRQYNPDAKVVFYMTWGRKNGDQQNAAAFPPLGTYEGMDSLLYARYMMMAEDNSSEEDTVLVSPVGHVWHYIRDNHPDVELYQADESHPSLIGSYAAACCFYTMLFQKDPENITFNSNVEAGVADMIKAAVHNLVYDSLSKWTFPQEEVEIPEEPDAVTEYTQNMVRLYPNPASSNVNISLPDDINGKYDISLYNSYGSLVKTYSNITGQTQSISMESLPDGIYFIRVKTGNSVIGSYKFLKIE